MRNVRARSPAAGAAAAIAGIALATLELASCVQDPEPEELAGQTIVITQAAPGTDFGTFQTFAIGDSIDVVQEVDGGQSVVRQVDPALATPTLEAIAAELTARGYRRVARTEQPDLGVSVIGVVRLNARVPYGVWWGAGSATGGYWGYTGVGFSSDISSTGISLWVSGALVTELLDLRAAREAASRSGEPSGPPTVAAPEAGDSGAAASIRAVWAAYVYGVLGGADRTIKGPPIDGIRQAFEQSPYLRTP